MTDAAYNVGAQRDRAIAAVSEAEHDEDIDEPGDAEADAPRVIRISRPVLKAELRYVDDVVEQPHSDLRGVRKALKTDTGF